MSSTSITRYEVKIYNGERWILNGTFYDRKSAIARAELVNKSGQKWFVWKHTERSELISKG